MDSGTIVAETVRSHPRPGSNSIGGTVAHTLRAEGHDASEDGTGRGTPIVFRASDVAGALTQGTDPTRRGIVLPFDTTQITSAGNYSRPKPGDPCHPLAASAHVPSIAYSLRSDAARDGKAKTPSADAEGRVRLRDPGFNYETEVTPTMDASQPHSVVYAIQERAEAENPNSGPDGMGVRADVAYTMEARGRPQGVAQSLAIRGRDGVPTVEVGEDEKANALLTPNGGRGGVGAGAVFAAIPRRITPTEAERLQGFPDGWTAIGRTPDGELLEMADSPRYRMLGNAVSVPVAEWIGRRLAEVEGDS